PPVVIADEYLLGDRLAQGLLKWLVLDPGDLLDRLLGQAATDSDRAGRALRVARQALDPEHEGVSEALRRCAATVQPGRQELLGVEGVPLTARVKAVHQPLVGVRGEDVGKDLR